MADSGGADLIALASSNAAPLANSEPAVGAVAVFWRGSKTGWSGHVGFVVGKDQSGNLMVLGGNQGDMGSIKPFGRDRVLGYRWPLDIPLSHLEVPTARSDGRLSQNEAWQGGGIPASVMAHPAHHHRRHADLLRGEITYLTIWGKDTDLSSTIANGLIILAGSVIGAYVFGAVWDDRNIMAMSRGRRVAPDEDTPEPPKDFAG